MTRLLANRLLRCTPILLLTILTSTACEPTRSDEGANAQTSDTSAFWTSLHNLCGQAFGGDLVRAPEGDTLLAGKRLIMHVRTCDSDTIRIPFHVADDRSRTWILSLTSDDGLRLAHRHLHHDGSPAANSGYGGTTVDAEQSRVRDFYADTTDPSASNIWRFAFSGDSSLVYGYRRGVDSPLLYELRFDLSQPIEAPPPPWGVAEDQD